MQHIVRAKNMGYRIWNNINKNPLKAGFYLSWWGYAQKY
jgi:hypothetical protein